MGYHPELAIDGKSGRSALEVVDEPVLLLVLAYQAISFGASRPLGAKEIWKVSTPAKVKHFFWLALHRRRWTAAHRYSHGLQQTPTCVLCAHGIEETDHILLSCAFSQQESTRSLGCLASIDNNHSIAILLVLVAMIAKIDQQGL